MSKLPRAEFILSAAAPSGFPADGLPEVALAGRSNVGKSSLLNQLAGIKKLAAVSRTPGRTQLINFFRVEERFYLVDLPGYGFARVPVAVRRGWEALVSKYLFERSELRLRCRTRLANRIFDHTGSLGARCRTRHTPSPPV